MIARSYNTKIDIYEFTEVDDGFGGFTNSENLVKSVWARIITRGSGSKFNDYGLNDFKNPVIFNIRGKNNLDITEKHFVMYKGKKFLIRGIENVNFENIEINLYGEES